MNEVWRNSDGETRVRVDRVEDDVVHYTVIRKAGGDSTGRIRAKAWDAVGPRSWGWSLEVTNGN